MKICNTEFEFKDYVECTNHGIWYARGYDLIHFKYPVYVFFVSVDSSNGHYMILDSDEMKLLKEVLTQIT
jgi:hypothetical protein